MPKLAFPTGKLNRQLLLDYSRLNKNIEKKKKKTWTDPRGVLRRSR